jgi:L-lactate dehydrogenase complex protein LldG
VDRLTFLARLRERLEQGAVAPGAAGPGGSTATAPTEARPRAAEARPSASEERARAAADASGGDLVGLFAERLRASGGEVALVASRAEAWAALERLAGERGWQAVACSDSLRPEGAGLAPGASERAGAGPCLHFTPEPRDADAGLSEADWAVAETGSVVVKASVDARRGYSLVPPVAGFFVPLSRLRPTMGDVLRELPAETGPLPSCVSFISGPSGTSDLAAVHVVGVHGPGEVFAWMIEGD